MRRLLLTCIALVAVAAFIGLQSDATFAFHDGGVATCTRCHSMHSALSSSNLLVRADKSSVCLSCHESASDTGPNGYHVSTAQAYLTANPTDGPLQRGPGGDFGWLRMTTSATASYGAPINNPGYTHGHNIVAASNGYVADTGTAPGGSMPAADLACTSCHDPHGQARRNSAGNIVFPVSGSTYDVTTGSGSYGEIPVAGEAVGAYRLLAGSGYSPYGGASFPGSPAAVVNEEYNRSEASTTTRVAYGNPSTGFTGYATWGKWCATCHEGMHGDTSGTTLVHIVDDALNGKADTYNDYVKTGDLSGVFPRGGPFTSLVPFAMNTADVAVLAPKALIDDTDLSGPAASDRILCLSCHRAHASAWQYGLRWNQAAEFLTLGPASTPVYPGTDAGLGNQGQYNRGYTVEQMEDAYYDRAANREFAGHQRSLCNKCHAKD